MFERAAKEIKLSPEAKALLGLTAKIVTGPDIVRAILALDVDLMWFGGIGTYVKASTESHGEVGDKVNDNVRINASELRAKVIGEGANLAITQRARTEYGLARRAPQHRRDRQLGRRRLQRSRGQPQDPARAADGVGRAAPRRSATSCCASSSPTSAPRACRTTTCRARCSRWRRCAASSTARCSSTCCRISTSTASIADRRAHPARRGAARAGSRPARACRATCSRCWSPTRRTTSTSAC